MPSVLSADDFLDWLAFWDVDPPDAQRADLRSYAHAILSTGGSNRIEPFYPYVQVDDDVEIDDEEIAAIVAAQQKQ